MTFTSRPSAWYWAVLLTGGAVLAVTGCKSGSAEKLVPVTGKVTVDGQALKTGSVSFRPDLARGNVSQHYPAGRIDEEGNYQLFVPPEKKGAPLGWYKVVVVAYDNPRPGHLKSFIDLKYTEENTTPLKIEVIDNPEPGRYDLQVTGGARLSK